MKILWLHKLLPEWWLEHDALYSELHKREDMIKTIDEFLKFIKKYRKICRRCLEREEIFIEDDDRIIQIVSEKECEYMRDRSVEVSIEPANKPS
ncbi:MAG TPA: hypothetical protein ENH82_12720 [bacterium]|nr:hypothetical protein [bacterium]